MSMFCIDNRYYYLLSLIMLGLEASGCVAVMVMVMVSGACAPDRRASSTANKITKIVCVSESVPRYCVESHTGVIPVTR